MLDHCKRFIEKGKCGVIRSRLVAKLVAFRLISQDFHDRLNTLLLLLGTIARSQFKFQSLTTLKWNFPFSTFPIAHLTRDHTLSHTEQLKPVHLEFTQAGGLSFMFCMIVRHEYTGFSYKHIRICSKICKMRQSQFDVSHALFEKFGEKSRTTSTRIQHF